MNHLSARAAYVLVVAIVCAGCTGKAFQSSAKPQATPPAVYVCHRASSAINLDGKLDDAAWKDAEWSGDFIDVRGKDWPAPHLRTRCKLLWDDTNLYIAAEMEDPDVWGTMTQKGSLLYEENNFEVFLDTKNDARKYWEFEINPLNTIWTLQLTKPLGEGGSAILGSEIQGLRTAVDVQGTLNNPADEDKGWTAEIIIPLKSLALDGQMPQDGEHWRMLMCRIEWSLFKKDGKYERVPAGDKYWAWVPTGAIAFHLPDKYGELRFAK